MPNPIYVERAKRWETNSWLAEWLSNAVKHCRDNSEGKARLEIWAIQAYGEVEGRKKLAARRMPPGRKLIGRDALFCQRAGLGGLVHLVINKASIELGVSEDALWLYVDFVAENFLCLPEKVKPAIRRQREEAATQWLARRQESLMQGCETPNMNWQVTRAIAISEYDRVKDTAELWRTDLKEFFSANESRAASTIPSPEIIPYGEKYVHNHTMSDAFRSRVYTLNLAHSCWSYVAEVFEDLARRGLCNPYAIERAYMRDEELMWRLISCCVRAYTLATHLLSRMKQAVTYCEHFRPFFKRWRNNKGVSRIDLNVEYLASHPLESPMDLLVSRMMVTGARKHGAFWESYHHALEIRPSEAKKFSAEAYEELGDLAVVEDFLSNMMDSAFGAKLCNHGALKCLHEVSPPMILPISPIDFPKLEWESPDATHYGKALTLYNSVAVTWLKQVDEISMWDALGAWYSCGSPDSKLFVLRSMQIFDEMWLETDKVLWEAAKKLDRPEEPGRVAKDFGLVDPNDPERSSYMRSLHRKAFGDNRSKAARTPAPAPIPEEYIIPFPTTAPSEPSVRSGHAHVKETDNLRPKEKTKTKGTGNLIPTSNVPVAAKDEGRELDDYPDILPQDFKLPRKVAKVFHRLLAVDDTSSEDEAALKRGQVRWNDFEKAMTRIGFAVIQTAGSSVRFDPPATTARPISFHRPHPDSILPPHLLKWIGARLKRTYGWTTATFEALTAIQ